MFQRLRTSSPARLALCLASFLAVAGAFGLHPEQPLRATEAAEGAEIARVAVGAASHACPGCLAHGAAVIGKVGEFALVPAVSRPVPGGDAPALFDRLAGRDLSGRSPPARS